MPTSSHENNLICTIKTARSVSKQGQLQPRCHSEARSILQPTTVKWSINMDDLIHIAQKHFKYILDNTMNTLQIRYTGTRIFTMFCCHQGYRRDHISKHLKVRFRRASYFQLSFPRFKNGGQTLFLVFDTIHEQHY